MLAELNGFLANSKVLEIEQKFYQNEKGAYWCFCVRYITGVFQQSKNTANKEKTDYKQVLSEAEFASFSKLRACRKTIAANDAVPAYAVFTDEELAGIAKLPEIIATNQ
jgi:superfamily II DNA helicase RecQ